MSNKDINIIFFGNTDFSNPTLLACNNSFNLKAVVTNKSKKMDLGGISNLSYTVYDPINPISLKSIHILQLGFITMVQKLQIQEQILHQVQE